jgi:hypothetical protein
LIYENTLQHGENHFLIPTLQQSITKTVPPLLQRTALGMVVEGFLIDESKQKPVWFMANPAIPGDQPSLLISPKNQTNRNASHLPKLGLRPKGRRLAAMEIRGMLYAATDRPWELQLVAPYSISFDASKTDDDKSETRRSSQNWLRLQAVRPQPKQFSEVATDQLVGRIRVTLPDGVDFPSPEKTFMVATRERCLATYGQHLLVFRFIPERVPESIERAIVKLDEAPVLIPADKVTAWIPKITGDRKVTFVESKYPYMKWDEPTQSLLIDPQVVVSSLSDEQLMGALLSRQPIYSNMTVDQALERSNDPQMPVMQMVERAVGRRPKGLLWSLPMEINVRCADGSTPWLAGSLLVEIDSNRLKKPFEERQQSRKQAMNSQAAEPHRRLKIVDPDLEADDVKISQLSAPLVPQSQQLLWFLFLQVVFNALMIGMSLLLSCQLFNWMFANGEPIETPSTLRCLGIAELSSLMSGGFYFCLIGFIHPSIDLPKDKILFAMLVAIATNIIAGVGIFIAGLTMILGIPVSRSVVITVLVAVISFVAMFTLSFVVAVILFGLMKAGMLEWAI